MKEYNFEFTTKMKFSLPISKHNFILKCVPHNNFFQMIYEDSLTITPKTSLMKGTDSYGNITISGFLNEPHESFEFSVKGKASLGKYRLPENLDRVYLYPSALTKPSEAMAEYLKTIDLPEDNKEKAVLLAQKVYELMTYVKGVTTVETTAAEAFEKKQGVCQDYAHVLISFLREVGVPARYVAGFIEGDGETHAWVEYYYDGAWLALDPTNNTIVEYGYIKLSHGLDSYGCSVERGCFVSDMGIVSQETDILVKVGEEQC